MRTIAHISDLHFGRHDPAVTEGLLADLAALRPDLVAVSGDLTQRARRHEFMAARDFLDRLPAPSLVVPGNHDVPLYNVARRAFRPLARFARYISATPQPFFADSEIAVLGLNTARAAALTNGRISREQIDAIRGRFVTLGGTAFRALVTHHPLTPPPHAPERGIVRRARYALDAVAEAGIELILTGHYHQSFTGDSASYHLAAHRAVLVSQAGTAISTRLRDESNSYNVIRIDGRDIGCEQRSWTGRAFAGLSAQVFRHREGCWTPTHTAATSS
ncbi:MAG: metallophosphoesterase [Alphaproteobacteria bacterium]|nr:metallophosphoesterase [Alphaproteobacteria bacterium]